jgi:hypothetical protein
MFSGVALPLSELPVELIEQHGLRRRMYDRGGELAGDLRVAGFFFFFSRAVEPPPR